MRLFRFALPFLVCLSAAPALADTPPPMISVSGEAVARLVPDQVTLPITIQSEALELNQAKQANDKKLQSVLMLARGLGIEDKKLQTQSTQIMPQYDYPGNGGKPVFRNYQVSAGIAITLTDPEKLPVLMDRLTQLGIDRIGSVQFGLRDEKKARDELLAQAAQDARGKAEKLASALGAKVGRPLAIQEQGGGFTPPQPPMPMMRASAMMEKADMGSPQMPGGEMEIRQNVSVSFALE